MEIKQILKQMVDIKASDIFIIAGLPFSYQLNGRQVRLETPPLTPLDTEKFIRALYAESGRGIEYFTENKNHDDDFSFAIPGIGRFRANVFRQRGSYSAVIRVIPFGLPQAKEMGIPDEILALANLRKGLILVTGPAGAGKSTTLACIIDQLNHERDDHIITLEDPIEFIHRHEKSIVTQREVPTDVSTYAEALRSAMREKPDVILLGEMRDYTTIETAMTAAEMAQLIFSTLHTTGASGTIDRIIDAFPASQQRQIRLQLSMVIQAIISQQLVPTTDNKEVPAFEIMFANAAIRNLIREEKTHQIDSAIAASAATGMRTMDQSLYELCKEGRITKETALQYSIHQEALRKRFAKKDL